METGKGVIVKLKEYECVEVKHHKDVGRTIKEWQENGWRLHTYQAVGNVAMATAFVNHYLLFEKGE
jgi:hypothetical protein